LRLVMLNDAGKPLADLPYKLVIGEVTIDGKKTDGDGVLEEELPAKVTEATLHIGGVVHQLALGGLNPMKDTSDASLSGVQARLLNLGYAPGPADGRLTTQTTEAILAFQRDNEMEMTGEIDDKLIDALAKAHGC
jgi:hypothetical protein